jgi:hypothetical protein
MADRSRVPNLSGVIVLAVLAVAGPVWAETADTKPSEAVPHEAYIGNESIETCMQRWDADTHMTKDAWRETCKRIKKEREPYAKSR